MSQYPKNHNQPYNYPMPSIMRCRLSRASHDRDPTGFGFSVKQRTVPPHLIVSELIKNGEAERSGLIRPGDMILKINDKDVSRCSYEEATVVLKSVPENTIASFIIRAPLGYTTRLETSFDNDGAPRTLRITEKIIKPIKDIVLDMSKDGNQRLEIKGFDDEKVGKGQNEDQSKNGQTESECHNCIDSHLSNQNKQENSTESDKCHSVTNKRATKLKNIITGQISIDTLHQCSLQSMGCTTNACTGSIINPLNSTVGNNHHRSSVRSADEILKHARNFIDQYYTSIKRVNSQAHKQRWTEIVKEVSEKGAYHLRETELIFGAKLAWRNAPRCIGRIQWSKLQVFDARYVTTAREMFEALCNHIKYSTNKGNIRSAITIFPQRECDQRHDFRVWNLQLISYAGFEDPETGKIIGDPLNVEFTHLCQKLGWNGKGTKWDILPLVLSASGQDPQVFNIPEELVLRVPILHPRYSWFKDLDLQWHVLPAVSNMLFDVGGLEFPACPFSGWYMVTEIAVRDLCDAYRYNILRDVAVRMGLDVGSNASLWRDAALVEVNIAVLDSFQKANATIVDHYTAAESFIKHMENEQRLRGGCPADWVWIVPPTAGSLTPVFHQEMLSYQLKPSYEYQEPAYRTHEWHQLPGSDEKHSTPLRKLKFKEIARAVKFTSNLFGKALSKRIKASILYATETGRSEQYTKRLAHIFSHAFNVSILCMDSYDMSHLEHETLLLIVTSTFGNGDPPENGEAFARQLQAIKVTGDTTPDIESVNNISTSHLRVSMDSDSTNDTANQIGPLSNIRYAVFGLGSSAYPNFCAFGRYLDTILADLGGERICKVSTGDELCGQEQAFVEWSKKVFEIACDVFCVSDDLNLTEVMKNATLKPFEWSKENVRLEPVTDDNENINFCKNLSKGLNRKIEHYKLSKRMFLHESDGDGRSTILIELESFDHSHAPNYMPGDHIGIYPENREEIVNAILKYFPDYNYNQSYKVFIKKPRLDENDNDDTWILHERLPQTSLREALTRYLDITTPPSQQLLNLLAHTSTSEIDKRKLHVLATDSHKYEEWKAVKHPNLLEVIQEFSSVKPSMELLLTQIPSLQSRFYSISSSPLKVSTARIDLTVAVVMYTTGSGQLHYGVCSNFLREIPIGHSVYGYIRPAPNFHLPDNKSIPVIMVGPGSGIAPFRGFWQHRAAQLAKSKDHKNEYGSMTLFFGCRTPSMQLHAKEIQALVNVGVINQYYTAFSRIPGQDKRYVQDCLKNVSDNVYHQLMHEKGHIYVCGDVSMAEDVSKTIKVILEEHGIDDPDLAVMSLREHLRYHEDIFGITLRTAEVTTKGRSQAMTKRSISNA